MVRNRGNAEHLDAGAESGARDSEPLAGMDLIAVDKAKNPFDDRPIDQIIDLSVDVAVAASEHLINQAKDVERRAGAFEGGSIGVAEMSGEVVHGQGFAHGIDDSEADGALEFADISGPIVLDEPSHDVGMNRTDRLTVFSIKESDEVLNKFGNVFEAMTQGREVNGEAVEAIE